MRYTFTNANNKKTTVEIPDSYIKNNCAALGITSKEAINMWLSDNGYVDDEIIRQLTEKAKNAGVDSAGNVVSTKKRKAPTRKPDVIKRALIANLEEYLKDNSSIVLEGNVINAIVNIEATNPERIIQFNINGDTYELTLSKKRKAK